MAGRLPEARRAGPRIRRQRDRFCRGDDSLEQCPRRQAALLEVRGKLPEQVTCPETKVTFYTDRRGGTVPKKSTFACALMGRLMMCSQRSGRPARLGRRRLTSFKATVPQEKRLGQPYSGRFFAAANDPRRYNSALMEWEERKECDLEGYWPTSELPFGFMTHMNNGGIPNHGYTHWWKMFNPLQLLIHSQLLKAIVEFVGLRGRRKNTCSVHSSSISGTKTCSAFGTSAETAWLPHLSNNNFHPKSNAVENCVFPDLGRGNWTSCTEGLLEGLHGRRNLGNQSLARR